MNVRLCGWALVLALSACLMGVAGYLNGIAVVVRPTSSPPPLQACDDALCARLRAADATSCERVEQSCFIAVAPTRCRWGVCNEQRQCVVVPSPLVAEFSCQCADLC